MDKKSLEFTAAIDYRQLVDVQREYFESGKTQPLQFRITQLHILSKMLKDNEDTLLDALEKDLGKPHAESYITELGLLYRSIRLMIRRLPRLLRQSRKLSPLFLLPSKSYTIPQSYGCALILAAYNYPLLLALDPLVGSIAGGNCSVVVLSEHTPHVNEVLLDITPKYFSKKFVMLLPGGKELNQRLLSIRFDKIFFTGSEKVGKIVMQSAAKHLTPVTLELGGKSPVIVSKTTNLKKAAERIAWGKFINAGATCVAPDYCMVEASVKDEFMLHLILAIKNMYGLDPLSSPNLGKVINRIQFNRLDGLLDTHQKQIVFGGRTDSGMLKIEPAIVDISKMSQSSLMEEEIFGPILPILTFAEIEETISVIKNHPNPLALYIFSEDEREIGLLTRTVAFGGGVVNDTVLHLANDYLPFGGIGHSGMGQYHGKYSFEAFTYKKAIMKRSLYFNPQAYVLAPPYNEKKDLIIRKILK